MGYVLAFASGQILSDAKAHGSCSLEAQDHSPNSHIHAIRQTSKHAWQERNDALGELSLMFNIDADWN